MEKHEYFGHEKEKEYLFKVIEGLSRYISDGGIGNIVLVDRAARHAAAGLRAYWKLGCPKERMPDIYFIDPEPIKEVIYSSSSMNINKNTLWAGMEAAKMFKARYRHLLKRKEKPTLIFDTCSHSGRSLEAIVNLLKRSRFRNLHTGTAIKANDQAFIQPDFYILEKRSYWKGCRVLGQQGTYGVDKKGGSIIAEKVSSKYESNVSREIRQEIREIIRMRFKRKRRNKAYEIFLESRVNY